MRALDADLLAALEGCWRRAGATYVDLPEEARRWYRWHDGSDGYDVTSHRVMTPLADDVESTVILQQDDQLWIDGWLRAMNEQPLMAFDCRVAADDPVPVWHYYPGFDMPTRPVFPSIGEMVAYWIGLIEGGAMGWVDGRGWRLTEPVDPDVLEHLGGIPTD